MTAKQICLVTDLPLIKFHTALVFRYGNREGKITFDNYIQCSVKLKSMMGTYLIMLTFFAATFRDD